MRGRFFADASMQRGKGRTVVLRRARIRYRGRENEGIRQRERPRRAKVGNRSRHLHAAKEAVTMKPSSKLLLTLFDSLRDHGFDRRGLTWTRRSDETVFVFELQASNHGDFYYINIGIWLLALGQAQRLSINRCHAYGRLGSSEVETALDFAESISVQRESTLSAFRDSVLVPLAENCTTVRGASEMLASGVLRIPIVRPEARDLLLPR